MKKISIIIRSKNEEAWIEKTLFALKNQICEDKEIILVDNGSTDKTIKIAKKFHCKIINYYTKKYNYSKALNIGIKKSKGDIIGIISAHCVPYDDYWIYNAIRNFDNPEVAGVYSKQLPTKDTVDLDLRSLFQVFRSDKIIQTNDFYFNNAASFIRKELWEAKNFDEKINGYEDLVWAKFFLKLKKKIVYEPQSKVFHFHGINHGDDQKRLTRHVSILKRLKNNEYC